MFGVRKLHTYLYGRRFKIYTDHKPLLGQSNKPIPTTASPRIQRWDLFLFGYSYKLVYRDGPSNGNAKGLSRPPLPTEIEEVPVPGDFMLVMDHLDNTPVQVKEIKRWTSHDPIFSAVRHVSVEFKPYISRKTRRERA